MALRDQAISCGTFELAEVTGRIENWEFEQTIGGGMVWGNIYDDVRGRFVDGLYIHTSTVVSPVTDIVEGNIIITKNSRYLLGKAKV